MNPATQNDMARLLLRVTLGVLILLHGISKLQDGVGGIEGMLEARGLPAELAYAVFIGEVLAPLMLIFGFYARLGAALVAINMVVAIVLVHMGQLASLNEQGGWAIELQAIYLVSAIALALSGPGRFGINGR